ncbi:lytic transglycosylase domain-containing protein [Sedimentitalea nanhaiensis]|uniref:Soluble lytic murein transglycosylase n=1 Tax=Sedimentitalea nanhaiensis TaxID=999627 RepID=A0A1I7AY35_9RHOB|nr:lytic transglycosylase domain-containing protein [Sedimentitalea nanhaiensis]SFT79860.1 Soluble lytic murein transglycosylase [Sedimentitalea nanhaiensis]
MFKRAWIVPAIVFCLCSAGPSLAERLVLREVSERPEQIDETSIPVAKPVSRRAPQPFSDFQARRVRPPTSDAAKRITIQIDPDAQRPAPLPPLADVPVSVREPVGKYTWFWDAISPEMTSTGPGRLPEALKTLNGSGKISAPRLQAMQEIARMQGVPILRSTVGTRVSPALVLAVIAVESAGRSDAVSGAGAQGLMQLMPDTAARFGVHDSLKPDENIAGGVKYLDWLMGEFNNDPILVLAGYNAGEGSVYSHAGVPPYAETRDYVPKVLAAFQVASGLCATPPELISDGCVFVAMN